MLTAAGTVRDKVDGLGLGADDYLTKPFDFAVRARPEGGHDVTVTFPPRRTAGQGRKGRPGTGRVTCRHGRELTRHGPGGAER
jgi:hypothetical protein